MRICTPEEAGISSAHVRRFYETLEGYHISVHSVILARGDAIFSECYYAPFHQKFNHRMYSTSKTFVAIAVGFCEQDGLLALDDPISKFFPEYLARDGAVHHSSTVRELLMMESTTATYNWFAENLTDRTATYFERPARKIPGTLFDYDSSGSYMLSVIVERLTGKPFLQYLREKCLDEIGFSREAYCLTVPGGYSWGDSGVMCTARDLLLFARFLLNGGTFNGKRYLNEKFMRDALTMRVCNNDYGFVSHNGFGYGYQIWGMARGCFSTFGMGAQFGFCDPKHDLVFVFNADTQGNPHGYEQVFEALYHNILDHLQDGALPSAPEESSALDAWLSKKELFYLPGNRESAFADLINGVTFTPNANLMGIKWFRLEFSGEEGAFCYENAQGVKRMPFGFGRNVFAQFPQTGYADTVGSTVVPGHTYRAAFSADWPEPQKLRIRVQIIDKYFGNLAIVFGFRDSKTVSVRMVKQAEDFLKEYAGVMSAVADE
ncbi:MAG: beta-lactamase family protein [Clostridia bacterium]|nr:beta-lactamase family protein [Clostridia bacterium]